MNTEIKNILGNLGSFRNVDVMNSFALPPQTRIRHLHLRVRSLETMTRFYCDVLGFERLPGFSSEVVAFGAPTDDPLILLTEDRTARLRSQKTLGLHHIALRYPTRRDVAHALRRLVESNYPITAAVNHGVAESIYIADPEGNAYELYAVVPDDQQPSEHTFGTPLDVRPLFALAKSDPAAQPAPSGLEIGHVHLRVVDLASAEQFFHDFLGLGVRTRVPGAVFLTASDEHHQVAINAWEEYDPIPPESIGLISYRLEVPSPEVVNTLRQRSAGFGYEISTGDGEADSEVLRITDPSGLLLELEAVVMDDRYGG